jgi:glycosyltransferase involved in cell wall biosynthesis
VSSLSLRSTDHIDVLNPEVLALLGKDERLAGKLSLTAGGTIVDGHTFKPAAKRDLIVFMGRVERYKNALAFVEAMPVIAGRVGALGKRPAFRIYGRPADQAEAVRALLVSPTHRELDIAWEQTSDPASAVAPAKVFVSLQSPSNYPSKALAEAMAAGCVPVISDSGESRRMADPALARFIPEHFTADELASAIGDILALDDGAFAARSAAVRKDALKRFDIKPQADYFSRLYRELAGEALNCGL